MLVVHIIYYVISTVYKMADPVSMITVFGCISGVISLASLTANKLLQPTATIEQCKPATYKNGYYSYEFSSDLNKDYFDAFMEYFMCHQDTIPNKNCPVVSFKSINYSFRLPAFNIQHTLKTKFGNIFFSIYAPDQKTPTMIIVATKKGSIFYRSKFMRFMSFGIGYATKRKHNRNRLLMFLEYVFRNTNMLFSDIEKMDREKYSKILKKKQEKRDNKRKKNKTYNKYEPYIPEVVIQAINDIQSKQINN